MKKRVVVTVLIIIALFFINFVSAESISEDLHLNIQTTFSNGTITSGTFNFVFNISKLSDCSNPIYTNSTTLTTDSRGIISYYLPDVSLDYSEQYYLCYYRNGVLQDSVKVARSPYSFTAKNVTLSGVIPDSNFNIGAYNMSARYYFGNGTYLVDVNDTLSQLSCANEQVVKWNSTSNLWYCSDVSSPGSGDIDAVNTDGIYLSGGQTSGTVSLVFNETKLNETIVNKISGNNASVVNWVNSLLAQFAQISNIVNLVGNWSAERVNYYNTTQIAEINNSMKNYVDSQNASQTNYINSVGNRWESNYTNMQTVCTPNFVVGMYENGTFRCGTVAQAAESDPYWSANYSAFNGSWTSTYNATENASITNFIISNNQSITNTIVSNNLSIVNYINSNNQSVNNYINQTNQSLVNYVNSNFVNQSGAVNLSVNNSQYLNGYNSNFFMPLNKSVYGQYDFNGGWTNNGISIINGNIYAQTGYFYNISSLQVSNLNINGSLLPYQGFDNQFDIGSSLLRWKDLYVGGVVNAPTANITGTLYVAGVNVSQRIAENNESMKNYVDSQNTSQTNYINSNNVSITNAISAVAAAGEPLWSGNFTAFNASWSNTYNATENASITNSIVANNGSVTNAIVSNNGSMNNYVNTQNTSQTNYINSNNVSIVNHINLNNASMNNYILSNNQSVSNAIAAVAAAGEPLWTGNFSNVAFINKANNFGAYNQTFNTNTLFIDSNNGRVGIGTTTPSQTLDIVGKIYASGNFKFNDTNESISIGTNSGNNLFATTALGSMAGYNNVGNYITAIGDSAGDTNTGNRLTAIGYIAGYHNTGNYLTATGFQAGAYNTGNSVTAFGPFAGGGDSLTTSNTGDYLTAMGYAAGYNNKGSSVTAIGYGSGYNNTGSSVTAVGYNASQSNTGNYSSGFGYEALKNNTGNNVVAIGYQAGLNNIASNQFIVQQANVNSAPLIQGNFSSGNVGIGTTLPNRTLQVVGNILASGTINATTDVCIEGGTCLSGVIASGGSNWNNNYSTFLTHITWANVMNGTLVKSSELNNGTYVTNLVLNNGSYLNYPWNATNTSYLEIRNWNATNISYMTGENFTLQNVSINNYINSNNQSVTNYINSVAAIGEPLWVANFTAFNNSWSYTYNATENASITNSIVANNASVNSYISSNNGSVVNYITSVNTSMNNYVNALNVTNNNYIASNNQSIVNWATSTFTSLTGIVAMVGNWSADKINYYNTTQVNDINTSMKNYVDFQNTSQTNLITLNNNSVTNLITANNQSVTNAINAVASAGEPLWTGNVSLFNSSWLTTYNSTTNDSIKNSIIANNASMNNYIVSVNTSMKNYVDSNNQSVSNAIAAVAAAGEPLWEGNYTNMQNPCTPNFVTGIYSNGTFKCGSVQQAAESDPYWNANYTSFNESWSYTYNSTTNDSITNSITANNASMNNYVNALNVTNNNYIASNNQSVVNWATSTFTSLTGIVAMVGNWSADKVNYYTTTQVNDINTSMKNYVDFQNTSQTNLITLNNNSVTNSITANNQSVTNAISAAASSGTANWNNNYSTFLTHITWANVMNGTLVKSSELNNGTYVTNLILNNGSYLNYPWNATNTSYMTGENFTLQNVSINNYINSNNVSVTNAINAVASAGEPLWTGNVSLFNSSWLTTYNSTTNDSIKNSIIANNASVNSYIGSNNASVNNYITLQNGSVVNYITTVNTSMSNYVNTVNTSMNNYVNAINESMNSYSNGKFFSNITNFTGGLTDAKYCTYNAGTGKIDCISESGAIIESDPKWTANYSTFLTHINWSQVMNGTLLQASQWNATNTSYMLVSNWNSTNTSYMLVSNWNATNTSYMLVSNWNATNTSYMTGENFTLQNTSMKNYIDWINSTISAVGGANWNNNYSQFLLNNVSVTNSITANNASVNSYIGSNNASIVNWATSTFTSLSGIIGQVGNWSADKVNYYNTTQVNDINTSMKNYVDTQNTSQTNLISLNNASMNNYIASNNQSVVNWATSTFTSLTGIVAMVGNWSADKINYYNTTQVNDINTSMKNYVDFQNTSQTNLITLNNNSVTNSITANNQSVTNAIAAVAAIGEPLWVANFSNVAFINKANSFGAYNQSFNTNTLAVDANNNRVGVGTTTPSKTLEVNGTFKANSSSGSINLDSEGNVLIGI